MSARKNIQLSNSYIFPNGSNRLKYRCVSLPWRYMFFLRYRFSPRRNRFLEGESCWTDTRIDRKGVMYWIGKKRADHSNLFEILERNRKLKITGHNFANNIRIRNVVKMAQMKHRWAAGSQRRVAKHGAILRQPSLSISPFTWAKFRRNNYNLVSLALVRNTRKYFSSTSTRPQIRDENEFIMKFNEIFYHFH